MRMQRDNGFYIFVQKLLIPIFRVLFGMQVQGAERFPKSGGVIVAVNHSSAFDPIILGLVAPRQLHFLAKAEL